MPQGMFGTWPYRRALTAAGLLALLGTPAQATLSPDGQKCSKFFLKRSAAVLKTVGKSVFTCTKLIDKGTVVTPLVDCVMTGPGMSKIGKAEDKINLATMAKNKCDPPYPMDCPPPCAGADAGEATSGIDDDFEFLTCLQCFNIGNAWSGSSGPSLQGVFGALTAGSTIGGPCQTRAQKLVAVIYALKIKLVSTCLQQVFNGSNPGPPSVCLTNVLTNPKLLALLSKLNAILSSGPCASPPFDGGACANFTGAAAANCIDGVAECQVCRWTKFMVGVTEGSTIDCDLYDDGIANGSCPVCGNNVKEGLEECDVGDLTSCPLNAQGCSNVCTCQVCGNGVKEIPEQCDLSDDAACPGNCTGSCTCP